MKPLPNALRQELARSQTAGPHPDADLLTAFSENALIGRERDRVLTHLAQCAECRRIVQLAEPPESAIPAAAAPSRSPRRLWVPLFVATGIAAAATVTVVLLHRPTPAAPAPVEIARNTTASVPPPIAATSPNPAPVMKKPPHAQAHAHLSAPAKPQAKSEIAQYNPAQAGAASTMELVQPQQQYQQKALQQAPREQAELDRDSKSVQPLSVAGLVESTPALANRITPEAVRAHWRLSATGQVERAIGEGPWQTVLASPRMRILSISGSDVWAGGDNLRLMHSADNGDHWTAVILPEKTAHTHAIAHIRAQSASSLTVEADDGTVWTTTDGGVTWQ